MAYNHIKTYNSFNRIERHHLCLLLIFLFIYFGIQPINISFANENRAIKVIEKNKNKYFNKGYALLIGVSDYNNNWSKLTNVPTEINQIEELLQNNGFIIQKVINPDYAQLKQSFENFIKKYGYNKNNRLLIYYSGHGYSRNNGRKGYIVPKDAPNPLVNNIEFLRKSISMTKIISWCRDMEANHVIFLFDSCFSGTIFNSRGFDKYPLNISFSTFQPVRQFITAGSADEEVPAYSIFAQYFIRALKGKANYNNDNYISGTELGIFLKEKLLKYSKGQTVQFGKIIDPELNKGDFLFPLDKQDQRFNKEEAIFPFSNQNLTIREECLPVYHFLIAVFTSDITLLKQLLPVDLEQTLNNKWSNHYSCIQRIKNYLVKKTLVNYTIDFETINTFNYYYKGSLNYGEVVILNNNNQVVFDNTIKFIVYKNKSNWLIDFRKFNRIDRY